MSSEPDEVSALIKRIEGSDDKEALWTQLYNIVLPVVRRTVEMSFWDDAATQDDVIQSALTRVLTAPTLKTLRTKGALLAFARVVALNEVRRAGAARTRTRRIASLDEVEPPALEHGADLQESLELGELVEHAMAAVSATPSSSGVSSRVPADQFMRFSPRALVRPFARAYESPV